MKKLIKYQEKGYGHFEVFAEINNELKSAITTNTLAIDAAFDDNYDLDCEGRFYKSQQEAIDELIEEINK